MTELEKRYLIKERSFKLVLEKGSIDKEKKFLKEKIEEYENLWGLYSCDCLGHAIICNNLMLRYIEENF